MSKAQPAEAGVQLVRATGLRDEYHLLDTCIKQLVKQLATRCVEWGEVLEVVRGRLCSLWARAWRSLLSLEAGEQPRADGAGGPARRLARAAEPEGADAAGTVAASVEAAGAGAGEGGQPAAAGALANYAAAVEVVGVSVRAGARVVADGYDATLSRLLSATPTPTATVTPGSRAHGDPCGGRRARSKRGEAAGGRAAAHGAGLA